MAAAARGGGKAAAATLLLFVASNCYVQELLTACEARGGPCGKSFFKLQLAPQLEDGEEREEEPEEGLLRIDTSKRERRFERNETKARRHPDAIPSVNETRRRRDDAVTTVTQAP